MFLELKFMQKRKVSTDLLTNIGLSVEMKSLGFINLPLTHQELENASSWESPRLRRDPCRSGTSCRSRRLSLYRRCGWRSRGSGRWPCWWSRTPGSQSPGSWRTRQEAGSCYHSGVLGPARVTVGHYPHDTRHVPEETLSCVGAHWDTSPGRWPASRSRFGWCGLKCIVESLSLHFIIVDYV